MPYNSRIYVRIGKHVAPYPCHNIRSAVCLVSRAIVLCFDDLRSCARLSLRIGAVSVRVDTKSGVTDSWWATGGQHDFPDLDGRMAGYQSTATWTLTLTVVVDCRAAFHEERLA
jgi:hypothetical protein